MAKKGFVKILEAIVASLVLLATISFFLVPARTTEWGDSLLKIQAQDTLVVLEKTGLSNFVKANDVAGLNDLLRTMVPRSADFSVKIIGIPNPEIYISCVCDLLSGDYINYKERKIELFVEQIEKEEIKNIDPKTNILMIDYSNSGKLDAYRPDIEEFLDNGGTLFIIGQLTEDQINTDGVLRDLVGLRPAAQKEGPGNFYRSNTAGSIQYRIAEYYRNISGNDQNSRFNFDQAGIKIDDNTIITDLSDTTSFAKAGVYGKGRIAWMSSFEKDTSVQGVNETLDLFKSMILWSSGEKYNMDSRQKKLPREFFTTKYISVLDGFEPYEIELTVWRIF